MGKLLVFREAPESKALYKLVEGRLPRLLGSVSDFVKSTSPLITSLTSHVYGERVPTLVLVDHPATRPTALTLSTQDRKALAPWRSKGLRQARAVNRAHILAALDEKVPERMICRVLGVGRTAIWRTRTAYLEGGLEYALRDAPRPGAPRKYQTRVEAEIIALSCSEPPAGAKRRTAGAARARARSPSREQRHQSRNDSPPAKENCLKPWRQRNVVRGRGLPPSSGGACTNCWICTPRPSRRYLCCPKPMSAH